MWQTESILTMPLTVFLFLVVLSRPLSCQSHTSAPIPGQRISFDRLSTSSNLDSSSLNATLSLKFSNQFSLQGKTLFDENFILRTLGHFNRERIPERVVHAKGATHYGTFKVTNDQLAHYTIAAVFGELDRETRVAVRFSTQVGERGSADTAFGEVRGFGVKFYTREGNYDLLAINLPVFFINDPQFFPMLNHAQKRDPRSDFKSADNQWDFFSYHTEALNGLTFLYSEYGLPDGYRFMPGFSVNAFRLVNRRMHATYARFMWFPQQGIRNLNRSETFRLAGIDPDYARRDLFDSIEAGDWPSWKLYVQLVKLDEVESAFSYNPFDATKLWPFDRFPPMEVGVMTLNKNVRNSFTENEQLALNPANLVAGIEPSPDRLLRGRLFAYRDTQFYRLGANHQLLPVNREKSRHALNERDGAFRADYNFQDLPNYFPNTPFLHRPDLYEIVDKSFAFGLDEIFMEQLDSIEQHYRHTRASYFSLTDEQRTELHENLAFALSSVSKKAILVRFLGHLERVVPAYSEHVRYELSKYNVIV